MLGGRGAGQGLAVGSCVRGRSELLGTAEEQDTSVKVDRSPGVPAHSSEGPPLTPCLPHCPPAAVRACACGCEGRGSQGAGSGSVVVVALGQGEKRAWGVGKGVGSI